MIGLRDRARTGVRIAQDQRGAVLTEFALLIPVMSVLVMGAMDIGHSMYMTATLQGAFQKAARDSGIEGDMTTAGIAAIDAKVTDQVKLLNKRATVALSRRYYRSFSATSNTMEQFTDTNSNGLCDNGEPFDDDNRNGVRDSAGTVGTGSAKDTVVYSATITYPRMFPMTKLINLLLPGRGLPANVTFTATTVMNNQPFGDQLPALVGNCT